MKAIALKESLQNWVDIPSSEMALAISLGLMNANTDYAHAKDVFWTNNPIGNMLHEMLTRLVEIGALEYRETDSENEFRWNSSFKASWEK